MNKPTSPTAPLVAPPVIILALSIRAAQLVNDALGEVDENGLNGTAEDDVIAQTIKTEIAAQIASKS